jgi:hypothetical protein
VALHVLLNVMVVLIAVMKFAVLLVRLVSAVLVTAITIVLTHAKTYAGRLVKT